jgi:twitching motility protein PilT
MIGEIRDRESAQAAITLAETGHLTLATLHTRGAISSVNRLIDMFPPEQTQQMRTQLSASLAGVIWQQLLPSKDHKRLHLACEVMMVTPGVRALIMKGNTHEIVSLLQTGRKFGMCTMEQAVNELREKDLIDAACLEVNFVEHCMALT